MIFIDPSLNTKQQNFKIMTASVLPRPIALITSLSEKNVLNAAPFSYFNIVTAIPPMLCVSIKKEAGNRKDTAHNILFNKEFVVHMVDTHNLNQTNQTSKPLPPNENEVEMTKLTPVSSVKIKVPGVKEAKIRMECILEKHVEFATTDVIFGKVVAFHIDDDIFKNGSIDLDKFAVISHLSGNDYARIGDIITLHHPE